MAELAAVEADARCLSREALNTSMSFLGDVEEGTRALSAGVLDKEVSDVGAAKGLSAFALDSALDDVGRREIATAESQRITGSALSGTLVDLGNPEEAAIELSQGAVGRALDNPLVAIFGGGE